MAWLVGLDAALAGKKYPLDVTFLVGRGPYNHVVLDDVRISRQHAKVSPEQGVHVVYDLNSANGTWVNDQQVGRHVLAPGDLVRFGPFRFRFEVDPDTDVSAYARRAPRAEELTRRGFEAPTKIVGEIDAQVPSTLIRRASLADLEDAERRLRTLFAFVQAIGTTLDAGELLDLLAQNLIDSFRSSEVAIVYTLDRDSGTMEPRRAAARDGLEAPMMPLAAELYLEVVQRGKALLSAPLSLDFEDEAPSAGGLLMHAPMLHRGAVLGVLAVRSGERATFAQTDLDLLTALASHAALALQNAKLHQDSLAQQRLTQDLALAQQIQKSFLPAELPSVPELEVIAEYRPAYSVGGDFYDVFWVSPQRLCVAVGDVSGKGISAALLMARVSSDLRAAMLGDPSPASALGRVNRGIVARGQHDIFVTAVVLSIDVAKRRVCLANAGHMPPYVRRREEGVLTRIEEGTAPPLGLFDDVEYTEVELALSAGDTLVLSTDGLHEATSERGQQLGFEGVEAALSGGPSDPRALADRLLAAVRAHAGTAAQYDDLTLLLCGVR